MDTVCVTYWMSFCWDSFQLALKFCWNLMIGSSIVNDGHSFKTGYVDLTCGCIRLWIPEYTHVFVYACPHSGMHARIYACMLECPHGFFIWNQQKLLKFVSKTTKTNHFQSFYISIQTALTFDTYTCPFPFYLTNLSYISQKKRNVVHIQSNCVYKYNQWCLHVTSSFSFPFNLIIHNSHTYNTLYVLLAIWCRPKE
jgi:hypothetical protein